MTGCICHLRHQHTRSIETEMFAMSPTRSIETERLAMHPTCSFKSNIMGTTNNPASAEMLRKIFTHLLDGRHGVRVEGVDGHHALLPAQRLVLPRSVVTGIQDLPL